MSDSPWIELRSFTIVEILGPPVYAYKKYWIPVQYESEGELAYTKVMCESYDEACELAVGDGVWGGK